LKSYKNWPIALKIGAPLVLAAGIAMAGLAWFAVSMATDALNAAYVAEMRARVGQFVTLAEFSHREWAATSAKLARMFAGTSREKPHVDGNQRPSVGGTEVPALLDGTTPLSSLERVDRFAAESGVTATLFVRSGDDFIRLATSLKDAGGKRALGTKLAHEHPAYAGLLAGKEYTGRASVLGKEFMTTYLPFADDAGKVIGVWSVGLDLTEGLAALRQALLREKVGQTGYFYVLDSRPGDALGKALVHPSLEGKNLIELKDTKTGSLFIRKIIETKLGELRYWTDFSGTAIEKSAVFATYEPWHWVITANVPWEEVTATGTLLRRWIVGITLLALAGMAFAMRVLSRRLIGRPLASAVHMTREVAGRNLAVDITVKNDDEVGQLAHALGTMTSELRGTVLGIRQSSDHIAASAAEIAAGNADLSRRTEAQAANIEETAASMEELTSTVQQNTDNAKQANQLAASTASIAERGGNVVRNVTTTMGSISESSKKIADIIGVIDGIAFQTNILALNAAVEAARAGEQGRGFAVVAAEVRALAQRSASAAREIKSLITESVTNVESGAKLVNEAGTTMGEVVSSVKRLTDLMAEITAASMEQSAGIAQVNEAVVQMDQATQQNAALVEEIAAAAEALETEARELAAEVATFRLREGGEAEPVHAANQPRQVAAKAPPAATLGRTQGVVHRPARAPQEHLSTSAAR
jgi:methyl-accepting chemotaxis protein-2 (aspartate sensor receptor)